MMILGNTLSTQKDVLIDSPIEGFNNVIRGNYSNTLLIEKMVRQLSAVREPNVDLLSEDFGYSPKKMNRLFLRVFGVTIVEYHRNFHMKYAKWLIEEKQIDEVSRALGFKTASLFVQVFKRNYFYMPQKGKPKRE